MKCAADANNDKTFTMTCLVSMDLTSTLQIMSDSSLDNPLENVTISFKYVGSNDLVAA